MLRSEAPARRRLRDATHPLVSLRSPLPMLVAGLGAALLVIALVTLPTRSAPATAPQTETLSRDEALTLVAREMRSGDIATQIRAQGQTRFDDGTWYVTLGDAQFHFSQRNRVIVADNDPAIALQFRETATQR